MILRMPDGCEKFFLILGTVFRTLTSSVGGLRCLSSACVPTWIRDFSTASRSGAFCWVSSCRNALRG